MSFIIGGPKNHTPTMSTNTTAMKPESKTPQTDANSPHHDQQACSSGAATPDTPEREWACNRCMYSWDGTSGWCPSCGEQATHGRAFAPEVIKKAKLMEKLHIIESGNTAILPTGEIVERGTTGSTDYESPEAGSKTPRTDAKLCVSRHPDDLLGWPNGRKVTFDDNYIVPADFARQLETELHNAEAITGNALRRVTELETELTVSKAREAELAAALEFINDECDWEPGGDYWNRAGDKRIGPACDKALEAWRAAK